MTELTLKGWKTYLASIAMAGIAVALAFGWITREMAESLYGLAGALGLGALRAGVRETQRAIEKAGAPGDPI